MRQRARTDTNHSEIVDALADLGWGVKPTHQLGNGFPDLMAVKASRIVLLEVKDGEKSPSRRKLTEDEARVHAWFRGYGVHVHTVTCVADLVQLDRDARTRYEP